jgi:DNA-binding MarR family transcriptional regulator
MQVKYLKYVPLQLMVGHDFSMNEVVFASILMSFNKEDKKLRAGQDNIAEAMGISGKTIGRIAKSLSTRGFITIYSGKKQRNANQYNPTPKLTALYGQNVPIDKDKMTNHTPKGYVTIPGKVNIPSRYSKEYQSDLANFTESYALERLQARIDRDKKKINN